MGRRTLLNFVGALALCAAAAVSAAAQDFQKTYNLAAGGSVEIANVSGDINLVGYEGSAVVVSAYKEGRDRDVVEVVDESTQGRVELRVDYPRDCRNCNASVRFEVRVPRSGNISFDKISTASGDVKAEGFTGRLRLSTASGDVTVRGVGGDIKASTASGTVRVNDATGTVNASTASGDLEVEMTRVEGTGDMRFSTASGDVRVRMPSTLDARVSMSTNSGDLETNFPIEVKKDAYGSGTRAEGQLGSGGRVLKISSASGNVSLKSM
ncbi:MAG TPA: DUF4097 family beta strand repeat-containing protein [Pyrinomonadaceae bacterium]|nr:DUF4097 family beta strand repeat-containing protein [Pyrinomonadaceae bacterium]